MPSASGSQARWLASSMAKAVRSAVVECPPQAVSGTRPARSRRSMALFIRNPFGCRTRGRKRRPPDAPGKKQKLVGLYHGCGCRARWPSLESHPSRSPRTGGRMEAHAGRVRQGEIMRRSPAFLLALAAALALLIPGAPLPAALPADGTVPSADGIPIRYHVEGPAKSPSPALVFVHCWSCDRHLWDETAGHFAKRYRVVTLALAGHGESGQGRKDWTIPAFGQDVASVVRALDLKKVILVGHSMGGPVILEAARALPDRVVGLVPVDTLLKVSKASDPKEVEIFLA